MSSCWLLALVSLTISTPPPWFGRAAPPAPIPYLFSPRLVPDPLSEMALPWFPDITFPSPAPDPPILFPGEPASIDTPFPAFGLATVPVTSVDEFAALLERARAGSQDAARQLHDL